MSSNCRLYWVEYPLSQRAMMVTGEVIGRPSSCSCGRLYASRLLSGWNITMGFSVWNPMRLTNCGGTDTWRGSN